MVGLAHAVRDLRPEWHQPGIMHHIGEAEKGWPGTDSQLYAHVISVAANPAAQTPAAFHTQIPASAEQSAPPARGMNEPSCGICQRRKSDCLRVHELEVRKGSPDPHEFESQEEAVANRARTQLDVERVDHRRGSELPYVPEDLLEQATVEEAPAQP